MPFCFSLAAVLRVRESLAQREEARLRAAHQELARTRQALADCQAEHLAFRRQNASGLCQGGSGAGLEFAAACQRAFARREQALTRRCGELEALRKVRQAAYLRARREQRAVETLRDEQRRAWEAEQARRTQQAQDELFLMRTRYRGVER